MSADSLTRALEAAHRLLQAKYCVLRSGAPGESGPTVVAACGLPGRGKRCRRSREVGAQPPLLSPSVYPLSGQRRDSRWELEVGWADPPHQPTVDTVLQAVLGYLAAVLDQYEVGITTTRTDESIIEIANQIQADVDLQSVLEFIVERARLVLTTELSWLGLIDDIEHTLKIRVATGHRTSAFPQMVVPAESGVGGMAITSRKTIVIDDYSRFEHQTTAPARRTVLAERVVSMICAPMFRGPKVIGALYVANRNPTEFSGGDVSRLSTLAAQASVAIDNARLVSTLKHALQQSERLNVLLEGKNRLLEDSEAIHHELTVALLTGMRVDRLGDVLARLVGRQLVIRQDVCPPFVTRHAPPPAKVGGSEDVHASAEFQSGGGDPSEMHSVPILVGAVHLGHIAVLGSARVSDIEQRALEHGATVLAVELLKERQIQAVEERLEGDALSALLEETGPIPAALADRVKRFGVDVHDPHYIVVLQKQVSGADSIRPGSLAALTRRVYGPAQRILAVAQGGRAVFAVPASDSCPIQETADRLVVGVGEPAVVGVSGRTGADRDYRTAYSEALACVRLAQSFANPGRVVTYERLGAMRFLLDARTLDFTTDVIEEWLGPLLEHDRVRHGQFVPTLRAYLDADGYHPTAAQTCFIHVSTLKYRLGVIRRVLGRPLSDPEVRFGLRVALRLMDILEPQANGHGRPSMARKTEEELADATLLGADAIRARNPSDDRSPRHDDNKGKGSSR